MNQSVTKQEAERQIADIIHRFEMATNFVVDGVWINRICFKTFEDGSPHFDVSLACRELGGDEPRRSA